MVGVTERTAHSIIVDLEDAGYITKTKVGRKNKYTIHPDMPLSDEVTDAAVGELAGHARLEAPSPCRAGPPSSPFNRFLPGRWLILSPEMAFPEMGPPYPPGMRRGRHPKTQFEVITLLLAFTYCVILGELCPTNHK